MFDKMFARLFEEGYTQIHINKNNVKSWKKTVKDGDSKILSVSSMSSLINCPCFKFTFIFGENDPIWKAKPFKIHQSHLSEKKLCVPKAWDSRDGGDGVDGVCAGDARLFSEGVAAFAPGWRGLEGAELIIMGI